MCKRKNVFISRKKICFMPSAYYTGSVTGSITGTVSGTCTILIPNPPQCPSLPSRILTFRSRRAKFNPFPPEPFASMIDVITAGQFMESAIHASDVNSTLSALTSAQQQLTNARSYFQTALSYACSQPLPRITESVYTDLINYSNYLICKIQEFINALPSVSNLQSFQAQVLYPFQGMIGKLFQALLELLD